MRLLYIATVLMIIGFLGAVIIIFNINEYSSDFKEKIISTSYQFLLFVVAGGAASWIAKEILDRRETERKKEEEIKKARKEADEKKQSQDKFKASQLKTFYEELIRSYNQVKSIRRFLRAESLREDNDKYIILSEPYKIRMDELMHIQLNFEFYKRHIHSSPFLYTELPETKKYLNSMEKYLRHILREYELVFRKHYMKDGLFLIEDLPILWEFIGDVENAKYFFPSFCRPFESCIKDIGIVITELGIDR